MPEHTNLAITAHSRMRMSHSLIHCEILVIGSHDLQQFPILTIEADEVLQDVNQPCLLKDTMEESLIVCNLSGLALAIDTLPFHETVLFGSDGSSLAGEHIACYAEGIIDEE